MLYDRWTQVVQECRHEVAVIDCTTSQRWTFEKLQAVAERSSSRHDEPLNRATGTDFVLSVLRAWRSGAPVFAAEPGHDTPAFRDLPLGSVHVKMTSASTGLPRMVVFTAGQLVADVRQIVSTMGLRRDWPNLGVISLTHSYGFSNLILPLLLEGIPLVLAESPLPESIRRAAAVVSRATLPAVPALWRTWFEARAIPANVSLAISAGAPLPIALEREVFAEAGLKIHNFYGATECGGIAYDSSTVPRTDATGVGKPMQNVSASINSEGCLCVRSPAVGLTYWPEAEPNLSAGCFTTTDLAHFESGWLHLDGRQSDQINVAGRKVVPENIERVIGGHPSVRECLVFGAPSSSTDRHEMIVACVVTESPIAAESLRQYLLNLLPAWQVPKAWWFVPQLPTNTRGKIARNEWRQKFLSRRA